MKRKAREASELIPKFVEECGPELERAVGALAERFERGGKLFTMGNGGSACDAEHAAVEFTHPIVERRRALPAQALSLGSALVTAVGNDGDFAGIFTDQLALLARPVDAVLGISTSGRSANVNRGLRKARGMGLLTLGLVGRDGGGMREHCDFCFVVPSWSIHRVQEVHTLFVHLLWDLVHVSQGESDVL